MRHLTTFVFTCGTLLAQLEPPAPAREFRGVWVATVDNIDWPSKPGLRTDDQRRELDAILDVAASMHLNAIVLQVRPTADAFYRSRYEPWSEWLTGTEGRAPKPEWDPLEYAVEACHRRGLELHAWFNPYRVRHPASRSTPIRMSVSRRFPDMVVAYGKYQWIDPGHPRAAEWSLGVILDVVERYDVDGVHLDDYFYPYPIQGEEFPDRRSYRRYRRRGGKLGLDDWRRKNVDDFIRRLHEKVKHAKPWVDVGISPFGIARPGIPEGIQAGIDQYAELYADVQKWLAEGWCDYIAPQLYWPVDQTPQSFAKLLPWWAEVAANPHRRHVWPGLYTSVAGTGKKHWREREILEQIELIRAQTGANGHIHFSMTPLLRNTVGLREALAIGLYAEPALVPYPHGAHSEDPAPMQITLRRAGAEAHVGWEVNTSARFVLVQTLRRGTWTSERLLGADVGVVALAANGLEAVALTAVDARSRAVAAGVQRSEW